MLTAWPWYKVPGEISKGVTSRSEESAASDNAVRVDCWSAASAGKNRRELACTCRHHKVCDTTPLLEGRVGSDEGLVEFLRNGIPRSGPVQHESVMPSKHDMASPL
jgi:hypothetical protein